MRSEWELRSYDSIRLVFLRKAVRACWGSPSSPLPCPVCSQSPAGWISFGVSCDDFGNIQRLEEGPSELLGTNPSVSFRSLSDLPVLPFVLMSIAWVSLQIPLARPVQWTALASCCGSLGSEDIPNCRLGISGVTHCFECFWDGLAVFLDIFDTSRRWCQVLEKCDWLPAAVFQHGRLRSGTVCSEPNS